MLLRKPDSWTRCGRCFANNVPQWSSPGLAILGAYPRALLVSFPGAASGPAVGVLIDMRVPRVTYLLTFGISLVGSSGISSSTLLSRHPKPHRSSFYFDGFGRAYRVRDGFCFEFPTISTSATWRADNRLVGLPNQLWRGCEQPEQGGLEGVQWHPQRSTSGEEEACCC